MIAQPFRTFTTISVFVGSKNQKYPEPSVSGTAVPAPLVPSGVVQLAMTWKRPPYEAEEAGALLAGARWPS